MSTTQKIKDFKKPIPTSQESPFKCDELFFSVTDLKSTMTFTNDVFVRVSRYEREELIGQLHKLIRHPDMPRAVFKIFWDHLEANKPVAAYVKNMAKDGSYYWVMALAFPCQGGYLSIRLKPCSDFFKKIKKYYAETLRFEKKQEKKQGKRKAMQQSQEYLLDLLNEEGFSNYDEFMWNALQTEMQAREEITNENGNKYDDNDLSDVPASLLELEPILRKLVMSLKSLKEIHDALVKHSDYILDLARSILLLSLNAQIGSSKLDQKDIALSVIAERMGEQSIDGEEKLISMKNNIFELSELIGELNFDIISAKLQVEMTIDFHEEMDENSSSQSDLELSETETMQLLYDAFMPRLHSIVDGLGELPRYLRKLLSDVKNIERFLLVLRFIHTTGKVEVARLEDDDNSFATTFKNLVDEVETAQEHLDELSDLVQTHQKTGAMYKNLQQDVQGLVDKVDNNFATRP